MEKEMFLQKEWKTEQWNIGIFCSHTPMISSLQTNIHYHTSNCYDLMEVIYYHSLTVKHILKMWGKWMKCMKYVRRLFELYSFWWLLSSRPTSKSADIWSLYKYCFVRHEIPLIYFLLFKLVLSSFLSQQWMIKIFSNLYQDLLEKNKSEALEVAEQCLKWKVRTW